MTSLWPHLISAAGVVVAGALVYLASRRENNITEARAKADIDLAHVNFRKNRLSLLRDEIAAVGALAKRYEHLDENKRIEFEERIFKMQLLMSEEDSELTSEDRSQLTNYAYRVRDKAAGKPAATKFYYKDYTEAGRNILAKELVALKAIIEDVKDNVGR